MTEMEMVRELRRMVAAAAGQAGGNREKVKAEIRAQQVDSIPGHGAAAPAGPAR